MSLTPEQCSRIGNPDRQLDVIAEIRVMEDGHPYWCDLSKAYPVGITREGGDPGVNRLMGMPAVAQESERGIGHYSTRPVTLAMRNDDGLFFRTAGVWLLDATGTERFLATWKRAWVRLRARELAPVPELDDMTPLGVWYIDKIVGGDVASLTLQPLERILQTASARTVKVGNRWIRDADVGELFQRVARHAMPGVAFAPGTPPTKVRFEARPGYAGTENPLRIGPVIDNLGRQPERIGGELTFDTAQIPTYIAEDHTDPEHLYYGTSDVLAKPRLWRYTIATGESELLWTGSSSTENTPIAYIAVIDADIISVACWRNDYPGGFSYFNRGLRIRLIQKATGYETLTANRWAWSIADAVTFSKKYSSGFLWSIGNTWFQHGHWADFSGEPLLFGFPQSVNNINRYGQYSHLENILKHPRQVNHHCERHPSWGPYIPTRRMISAGGWSSANSEQDTSYPGPVVAWHHLAPFPTGVHYLPERGKFYWLEFFGDWTGPGHWRLCEMTVAGLMTTWTLEWGSDAIRKRMPTCFIPVSNNSDPYIGAPMHGFVIGTYWHRMTGHGDGSNIGASGLWYVDLDALPPGGGSYYGMCCYQEWDSTESDGDWPIFLDGAYVNGGASGDPGRDVPRVIGCWLNRRTRLYSIFEINLATDHVSLKGGTTGDTERTGVPTSSAPFTGFRSWRGEMTGPVSTGRRRCFFRDCGTGMLWEWMQLQGSSRWYRTIGEGQPVDPTSTWDACPRLALIQDDVSPTNSQIFGFSAPGPPPWVFQQDSLGHPHPNPAGSYRLWALGQTLTSRVPLADFSDDCAKNAHDALTHLVQAAGSDYRWGFNRSGEIFFSQRPTTPVATLVPADEAPAWWGEMEIPIIEDVERDDHTEDDVANQIHVVPWVPEVPAVSTKLELAPRPANDNSEIGGTVMGRATTDAAVRVVLHVMRDGMIGGNDLDDQGYTEDWDTGLLLIPVIDTEDIVTELVQPTGTLGTIRVQGMRTPASGETFSRLIGEARVYRAYATHQGDYIIVGDSSTGRITGFSDPDVILTSLGTVSETVPAGTTVRIMPRSCRGAKAQAEGGDGGVVTIGGDGVHSGILESDTELNLGIAGGDVVHAGDVIIASGEAMLVLAKWPLDEPSDMFTHRITVERGYLGTKAILHNVSLVMVCVHPRDDLPRPIGSSGITAAFLGDPTSLPWARALKSGDRFILEFPGVRATASKYNIGIAEGAASIARYGKREQQIKENPYMSTEVAPHYAYHELEGRQWERSRFRVTVPWAPELALGDMVTLRSRRVLPSEVGHVMDCWITAVQHQENRRRTVLSLLSAGAVTCAGRARSAGTGQLSSIGTA